ncbi:hypothetical protein TNCV_1078471 [Trichonephila clavipes]|nr:hypothetical protein TNCV_1078471 [Trichonephila clavipes]
MLRIVSDSGSLVAMVTDSWQTCHEFEPSVTEDPPFTGRIHVKSLKSQSTPVGTVLVKASDSWPAGHEFEPCTSEDPPCRGARYMLNMARHKRPPVGVV